MNWVTFCVLFLIWGMLSWVFLGRREKTKESLAEHGLIGLLGALASMLLMTAFSFVPDDWSANRIAVPLSWLYGYPIYSSLEKDPSNCNFYLPFGFAGYLPTALISYLIKSPDICLFSGWVQTLVFYFTPIGILLIRFRNNRTVFATSFLFAVIVSLSSPALRYIATMIHVDAFGLFCIGSAIALITPISESRSQKISFTAAGILLGLSFFIKQTFIPFTILIIIWVIYQNRLYAFRFLLSLLSTIISCILLTMIFVDVRLLWLYGFEASSSVPSIRSYYKSLIEFIIISWPILLIIAISSFWKKIFTDSWVAFLLGLGILASIFSIYTYTKAGADVNHFSLPLYLFLILLLIIFVKQKNINYKITFKVFLCVILLIPQSFLFFKTYCGWFLWVNNSHRIAYQFYKNYPSQEVYFPWQPLSALLAKQVMYHLDQGCAFEEIDNVGYRSVQNQEMHLPSKPFKIAVRPYGAPSYLVEKLSAQPADNSFKDLEGWRIYNVE